MQACNRKREREREKHTTKMFLPQLGEIRSAVATCSEVSCARPAPAAELIVQAWAGRPQSGIAPGVAGARLLATPPPLGQRRGGSLPVTLPPLFGQL